MSNLNSILLITRDKESQTTLADLLARSRRPLELSAFAIRFPDDVKLLESFPLLQLVILEVRSISQGVRDIAAIATINPRILIIAISREKQPDWGLTLIQAGADEYLANPTNRGELEDVLGRAALIFEQKQKRADARGKVITVYNPSGGMGTTTIAVNLAVSLVAKGQTAALIDLNPFSGDAATLLDLNPTTTLTSFLERESSITPAELTGIMTRHGSGVQFLSATDEMGMGAPDQMPSILNMMRSRFGATVLDAGGSLSKSNLDIFGGSDVILYPLLLTRPAINNAGRYLKALKCHGFGPDLVKVVVNRYLSNENISMAQAEKLLEVTLFHTIPNSYMEINSSIYHGTPLVTGYPRSPVTMALAALATRVTTELTGNFFQRKPIPAPAPFEHGFFSGMPAAHVLG